MSVMDILVRAQDQASRVLDDVQGELKNVGDAADRAGEKTGSAMERAGQRMGSIGRGLSLGVTLPLVAIGATALRSLGRIEVLGAQTESVIKATGGAAGVSAQHIAELADSIERNTSVEAESVLEGQNLLLTFKNIKNGVGEGNDVFDQSTKALVDMAVAMGQDPKSAAIQLGKALNDPVQGISALTRVGVTFTDKQKAMITSLVEAGDTMRAQKIILEELNSEFGGSAEALGDTMQGRLTQVTHAFGTMTETLASQLLPMIEKFTGWLQKMFDWFNNLSPGAQKIIGLLVGLAAAVGPVLIVASKLIQAFQIVKTAFAALNLAFMTNPFVLLIAAVVALVVLIVTNWDKIKEYLLKAWNWIKDTASSIWNGIKDFFSKLFSGIWNAIKGTWDTVISFFKELPGKAINALAGFASTVYNWILDHHPVVILYRKAKEIWPQVTGWFKELPGRIVSAIGDLGRLLFNAGQKIIQGLWDGLKNVWSKVTGWFSGIGSWIADHKGPAEVDARLLTPNGRLIMSGLLKGLQAEWPRIADFISSRGGEFEVGFGAPKLAAAGMGGIVGADTASLLREQNDLLRRILDKTGFSIDGRDLVDSIGRPLSDEIRSRTGL